MDYRDSGVNREAGDAFVDRIEAKMKGTQRPEVLSGLGDFGASFVAPAHYRQPVFVASTDGVGTKLMLAEVWGGSSEVRRQVHRAMGQDVVAMCVNDLLCCRAEPLVFLDYVATGTLDRHDLDHVLEGIIEACRESNCSLIGGETAEMPGFYPPGRYDIAGFAIGVVEREARFNKSAVGEGDLVYGMASSGLHSNGFSLIRRVLDAQKWSLDDIVEGRLLGELLLEPTTLYVKDFLKLSETVPLKGAAHITGGGLVENLPRAFDETKLKAVLNETSITTPAWMQRFCEAAKLDKREAFSTWNMGIGFTVIVPKDSAAMMKKNAPSWIPLGELASKTNSENSVEFVA